MGNPQHFSLELPGRCLQLIEDLWPHACEIRQTGDRAELGPLTTTFLLAMATPIINLPYERVKQHIHLNEEGYADDRPLNAELVKRVHAALGGTPFSKAPFFHEQAWSFAQREAAARFNIARPMPHDLCEELGRPEAFQKASKMPASQWISCLRNALAHGGIAYLNGDGHHSHGEPVKMFAFVSAKYDDDGALVKVNVLRIPEEAFRGFLGKWVQWLGASELADNLAA